MPGAQDREPSDADRPPVSRVGDELQEAVERGATGEDAEAEAHRAAEEKLWDQEQTRAERGAKEGDGT